VDACLLFERSALPRVREDHGDIEPIVVECAEAGDRRIRDRASSFAVKRCCIRRCRSAIAGAGPDFMIEVSSTASSSTVALTGPGHSSGSI
jgi:hypothetical protein